MSVHTISSSMIGVEIRPDFTCMEFIVSYTIPNSVFAAHLVLYFCIFLKKFSEMFFKVSASC